MFGFGEAQQSIGSVWLTWWLMPFVVGLLVSMAITFLLQEWPTSENFRRDYVCRVVKSYTRYNNLDRSETEDIHVDVRTRESAKALGVLAGDNASKNTNPSNLYNTCGWDIVHERVSRKRMTMIGIPLLVSFILASVMFLIVAMMR